VRDFTLEKYQELCETLLGCGYAILTVRDYLQQRENGQENVPKTAILRHDVDRKPENALRMARLENEMGICSTYYFRYPYTFKPEIIRKIRDFGHEIGYHYEVLAKAKGDPEIAIRFFEQELKAMRDICEINTICMHGSPLSSYDNRDLWKEYDFRNYGVEGEAYLSIGGRDVRYLTDTGRSWSGKRSVRDIMPGSGRVNVKTTDDLVAWIESSGIEELYLTVHPERWAVSAGDWAISYMKDVVMNTGKNIIVAMR
jgi:hypothetical protein